MKDPEWLTKAEAAAVLACDERTIERRARAGRIGARARPGFPTLYRAADVENLRQTTPQEVQTGILEPGPAAPSNGSGAVASLRPRSAPIEGLLAEVLQAILGALAHGPTGPTGATDAPTGPTLFLTVDEAAAHLNWTPRDLRRAIRKGDVLARNSDRRDWRTWRIRRKDLEAL